MTSSRHLLTVGFVGSLALVTVFIACSYESDEEAWGRGYARGYRAGERLAHYNDQEVSEIIVNAPDYIQGDLEEQADRAFRTFAMTNAAIASLLKNDSVCWEGYHEGYFYWFWDTFMPAEAETMSAEGRAELKALDARFQEALDEAKELPIVLDSVETMREEGC